ncbi:hypothetical protein ACP4OV_014089 [Aristida adscensionis]
MDKKGCTNLTEAARSVQLLKVDGFSAIQTMCSKDYIESRWNVDGHEWAIHLYPSYVGISCLVLKLIFLGKSQAHKVRASLSCGLVHPSGNICLRKSMSKIFQRHKDSSDAIVLILLRDLASGYLKDDSFTVECSITVLKEIQDIVIPDPANKKDLPLPIPTIPSSNLHRQLCELLQSQTEADVTFVVSGERFPAHKLILAARSPVFKAEFFGHMSERTSQRVKVKDMEAGVFKAMLHFIYTDTVPELDEPSEAAMSVAQHLLAAADRYGLERLKVICESKLAGGIDVGTAATTLALAEQHDCSLLKAKCVEFITGSPEKLDAVLATEGYKHLMASCPLMLTELVN